VDFKTGVILLELWDTSALQPKMKKITHITRNRKNKTFAIPADAAAIPPNPNVGQRHNIFVSVMSAKKFCERLHWFDVRAENLESG
jgi:hypothetical protein